MLAKHDSARGYASRQPAKAPTPLPFELVLDDGEPLETEWHTLELPLLRQLICRVMAEQGRNDFHVATNVFVYYSIEQAREVADEEANGGKKTAFRGPDVFWVGGVEPRPRQAWIAWEEDGRLPDVIFEMLSPSTATKDRTEKRDLYARVFGTAEYYLYDPDQRKLEGLHLEGRAYREVPPDGDGRIWSPRLGAFIGLWRGVVERYERDFVRLFRADGSLVPTETEAAQAERLQKEAERQRAEGERQRAEAERLQKEAERQRAEAAEAEVARLRALLGQTETR